MDDTLTKKFKFILIFLCLITQLVSTAHAQDNANDDLLADTKKDLMMVSGIGLVGAVLGLSTLSFVEEPKDHLKNIVVGGAVGIIVGVGVVAWMQASKSKSQFESARVAPSTPKFTTVHRHQWHRDHHEELKAQVPAAASATQFQFSF